MLKKTITYKDLDDNDVTEDFYFNLSKAEIAEMEMSQEGGLSNHLKAILVSEDRGLILSTFKMIISASVGKRSEDGKRFIKNDEIRDEFMQTDAYSVVFMGLVTDAVAAAEFIKGVIPQDIAAQVPKLEQVPEPSKKKLEDYTREELLEMPTDEFQRFMSENKGRLNETVLAVAMHRVTKE